MDEIDKVLSSYITLKELSKKWGIGKDWIFKYLQEDRIEGAKKIGNKWFFPKDVEKPEDRRCKSQDR